VRRIPVGGECPFSPVFTEGVAGDDNCADAIRHSSAPGTPALAYEKRSQRLALEQAHDGPPFAVPGGARFQM